MFPVLRGAVGLPGGWLLAVLSLALFAVFWAPQTLALLPSHLELDFGKFSQSPQTLF